MPGNYTVKAGQMTSQVAAALAAARNADRSQHAGTAAAAAGAAAGAGGKPHVGDASVRFGRAHTAASPEGFAQRFGPYAGARALPPAAAWQRALRLFHCLLAQANQVSLSAGAPRELGSLMLDGAVP